MRGPFLWALFAWFVASSQPVGQGSTREAHAEMNAVARADFVRADAGLNKTYQAVLAKLRDGESKQKLRETQRAWLASRDAEAARAAKEAEGGSMAPTIRYETMTHLTRERIKDLKAMLDQGIESGPTPAATNSAATSPSSTPEPASGQAQSVSETGRTSGSSASSVSPDKKWEYKLVDGSRPGIVRGSTSEVVLDLTEFVHPPEASEVVWAPDSKRFAFNYQAGTRYQTTDCYQLHGDTWQELDDPECDNTTGPIKRSVAAQKKKLKISADKYTRPILTSYHIRKWIDANTALLYASREESFAIKNEIESLGASFFFTLKFDPDGTWKIVRTCEVPRKGSGGLNRMEQEELKRIEKEEGQETSTIGDHIYHHQP